MRLPKAVFLASLLALLSGAAFSQVQTGNEVTFNPIAGDGAEGSTLLYPGGQYMRVVKPLLQPGQSAGDSGTIQLHMPVKRAEPRTASVAPKPAPPPKRVAVAPPPKPAPAPTKSAAAAPARPTPARPAAGSGYSPGYGAFGAPAGSAAGLNTPSIVAPGQVAKAEPSPAARAPMA